MSSEIESTVENCSSFLTTGDVARMCGVHFRTVIRWIQRGQLPAFQLPGRGDNRISREDLSAFLARNRMTIPKVDNLRRILIVDDEPNIAAAIQRVFHQDGYETCIAHNGFQAGTLLHEFRPSLMTLDIKMPGMTGLDVIRFVGEQPRFDSLKILVISAMSRSELEAAVKAGADAYLEKPFLNEMLRATVRTLLPPLANTAVAP